MDEIWNEAINWWKKQSYQKRGIILFISALAIFLCFKFPDGGRNLIFLIAGLIGWHFINRRTKAAEQNVTVERLNRAIEQIANQNQSIRFGGFFGLGQIALSHEEERSKIMQMISARIRELTPSDGAKSFKQRYERLDIETAIKILSILGEPLAGKKSDFCELQRTDFNKLWFFNINLSHFVLSNSNFSNTVLWNVDFSNTELKGVNFSDAFFKDIKGLTQEQLEKAFYLKGHPPVHLPDGLELQARDHHML